MSRFHRALTKGVCIIGAYAGIALAEEPPSRSSAVDLRSAWFKPVLVADNDPICKAVLASATKHFASDMPWQGVLSSFKRVPGPFQEPDRDETDVTTLKDDLRQFELALGGNKWAYVHFSTIPGCGGACEGEQLLLSDRTMAANPVASEQVTSTPPSDSWSLLRQAKGKFFAVGVVSDHLLAYRITSPREFKIGCDIALAPDDLDQSKDPAVSAAFHAIENLRIAADRVAGGEGWCGSSRTSDRWRGNRKHALRQTLYRPWALITDEHDRRSENSFGDYSRIEKNLALWSLGGLAEANAYRSYKEQLNAAIRAVAEFYQRRYGWTTRKAINEARRSLTTAISRGFGFYLYAPPFPDPRERDFRIAILERKPLAAIQAFDAEQKWLNDAVEIAIDYPAALRFLLKKGADPDTANAFGKTPLMYSAQRNRIEAAIALLEAGADPNSATTIPSDTCNYALETRGMTPLHYSARYASVDFVRLLVDKGAKPYSRSKNAVRGFEYPIDWLHRFTSDSADGERNPNISNHQQTEALALLKIPDNEERIHIAKRMVDRAQSEYVQGKYQSSYRSLHIALMADPENMRAIADLPLVALRAGFFGPAINAAHTAVKQLKDPSKLAAAWFNMGLICEQSGVENVNYDGHACGRDQLQPFMRVGQIEPTVLRKNKLKELITTGKETCVIERSAGALQVRVIRDYLNQEGKVQSTQRIYVLHRPEEPIESDDIEWTIKFSDHPVATTIHPRMTGQLKLSTDEVVTVLEGTDYTQPPTIFGHKCKAQ